MGISDASKTLQNIWGVWSSDIFKIYNIPFENDKSSKFFLGEIRIPLAILPESWADGSRNAEIMLFSDVVVAFDSPWKVTPQLCFCKWRQEK